MKLYALCPISDKKVNDRVTRLNATFTVLLLILYVFTTNLSLISFLLIDFFLRSAELSQYSPIAFLSRNLVKLLKIKPKYVNAGPKIFAARIGVVFNICILVSAAFGSDLLGFSFTVVFGACAFLEAAFGLCVACQIYPFVYKFFYHSKLISEK